MPSNRKLKSDDVDGFMMACWDSIVDLEYDYKCTISVTITARSPRGYLTWRAYATQERDGVAGHVLATAEALWPTHYSKTPHGLLYSLLVRLWRELETTREERQVMDSPDPRI